MHLLDIDSFVGTNFSRVGVLATGEGLNIFIWISSDLWSWMSERRGLLGCQRMPVHRRLQRTSVPIPLVHISCSYVFILLDTGHSGSFPFRCISVFWTEIELQRILQVSRRRLYFQLHPLMFIRNDFWKFTGTSIHLSLQWWCICPI